MAKIRDGANYLSRHLAANDYYCENETVVGQWVGSGAERLGLTGEIRAGDVAFENLRRNRLPDGSGKLTPRDGAARIRFYDFQCSAPKSVSIMAVTLGDERLLAAHDRSAVVAFAELEKFAATQANTVLVRQNRITSNVTAGKFRHTASRALDPQVHTHHVTAAGTWDEASGGWRALTEFEMVRAVRYAGKVYQNELARSCRELGYEIAETRDGRGTVIGFEIAGVDEQIRERFSKRRAEVERGIEQFTEKHGRTPSPAEIHAIAVETREIKLREATTPAVLTAQRAQLSTSEWARLVALRDRAQACSSAQAGVPRERESVRRAIGHLFERRSVAVGHEIAAESLNQNLGYLNLRGVHAQLSRAGVVNLTGESFLHAQIATPRGLALERWSLGFIERGKEMFPALAEASKLDPKLSIQQREAAEQVLGNRDQVVCLRGAAGVGKTTVLQSLHACLETAGHTVHYCAPTSSAADTLRREGIARATTVADFLENVARRESATLDRAVFVVDEAGLASNVQGAAILRLAERHQARVIFLGDSRQHTSVEAGDFVRVLERYAPVQCVELTEIRRQLVSEYRAAIKLMAVGGTLAGLEHLDRCGWLKEGKASYLRAAAAEFVEKTSGGTRMDAALAVTPTWAENRALTTEVRKDLKRLGVLGEGETVAALEPLSWTRAEKRRPESYEVGMVVTFNRSGGGFSSGDVGRVVRVEGGRVQIQAKETERPLPIRSDIFDVARVTALEISTGERLLVRTNYRREGLLNGDFVTVRAIQSGVITASDGRVIDTARVRHLSHGYAVTSHKSQSKTADHVIVAAERLNQKSAYVACSRGRLSCSVHVPDKANLVAWLADGERPAAIEVLRKDTRRDAVHPRDNAWGALNRTGGPARTPLQRAMSFEWWRETLRGWCHLMPGHSRSNTTRQDHAR